MKKQLTTAFASAFASKSAADRLEELSSCSACSRKIGITLQGTHPIRLVAQTNEQNKHVHPKMDMEISYLSDTLAIASAASVPADCATSVGCGAEICSNLTPDSLSNLLTLCLYLGS